MAERDTTTATVERRNESLPALFGRLTDELMQLVDAKLELLKTEITQEARAYAVGAMLILIGGVVATIGFALINVAIAFLISMFFNATQWSPPARYGLGFVITAVLYLAIGAIIIVVAKNRLAKQRVAPKSAADLRRDKEFVKQQF
jgi:ABC-type multidrug transport system fused ATPase/permease subunit